MLPPVEACGAATDRGGRMEWPTKVLLAGVAVAAGVVALGYGMALYERVQVEKLVAECKTQHTPESMKPYEGLPLVCDPAELLSSDQLPAGGIQARIRDGTRAADEYRERSLLIAPFVLILFALPFSWYFLLARIRELGDALRGR